jgi:hypothetical protein
MIFVFKDFYLNLNFIFTFHLEEYNNSKKIDSIKTFSNKSIKRFRKNLLSFSIL